MNGAFVNFKMIANKFRSPWPNLDPAGDPPGKSSLGAYLRQQWDKQPYDTRRRE